MTCRYSVKVSFKNESAALAEREKIKRRKGTAYNPLYPYPCPDGPHWHLSHHEQGIQQCSVCHQEVPAWRRKWWVIAAHSNAEGRPCTGESTRALSPALADG